MNDMAIPSDNLGLLRRLNTEEWEGKCSGKVKEKRILLGEKTGHFPSILFFLTNGKKGTGLLK